MQTLNVGAGRTDEEYKAAEEQRRGDLLAESRACTNYFYGAAVLAALGTGLLPIRLYGIVNIGLIDLLPFYGGELVRHRAVMLYAAAAWVVVLILLAVAAQKGHRWAFLAGVVLYAADMIALCVTFSLWSFGVHGFFVYKWFQGQRALRDYQQGA
jgi:hypothetical protein